MDKVFGILGDIHANLDALEVVLEDCRANGVTDFLCTGDVVGYNACPRECLAKIRELGCPVVMGNHDYYVSHAAETNLDDFNESAKAVIEWTQEQLTEEELEYLYNLPFTSIKMGIMLVHSTLDQPEKFGYVFNNSEVAPHFPHQTSPICFNGHTHCPVIFEKTLTEVSSIDVSQLPEGRFTLQMGKKYFINVGSVGQPRDLNPKASYVIYTPKLREVRFRRLDYDIELAQSRIRAAGLPEKLATRLAIGR